MARIRSNRVCFTINNYDQDTLDGFERFFDEDKNIVFGVVGQEIGENGTPHLQGFVHYNVDRKKGGVKFWKDLLPGGDKSHLENARGTDADSEEYCSKEGVFIKVGTPQETTDRWMLIYETAKTDLQAALAIDPEISIRHYHQLKAISEDNAQPKLNAVLPVLREWQSRVLQQLRGQEDRKILFIVDEQGGKGKSALTKHILTEGNAWACQGTF